MDASRSGTPASTAGSRLQSRQGSDAVEQRDRASRPSRFTMTCPVVIAMSMPGRLAPAARRWWRAGTPCSSGSCRAVDRGAPGAMPSKRPTIRLVRLAGRRNPRDGKGLCPPSLRVGGARRGHREEQGPPRSATASAPTLVDCRGRDDAAGVGPLTRRAGVATMARSGPGGRVQVDTGNLGGGHEEGRRHGGRVDASVRNGVGGSRVGAGGPVCGPRRGATGHDRGQGRMWYRR